MTQENSGSTGATETENQSNNEQMIPKKDVEKLAAELAKYKQQAEELSNRFKNQEIEAAKAANDWQKVAEAKEREALESIERLNKFKNSFITDKKLSALREEAIKAGIRKEALDDIRGLDYPEVKLQTDDEGYFKVEGVDKAIQRLKTTRPFWFQDKMPSVNLNSPNVTGEGGGKIQYSDIKKLEAEYKKNPNASNEAKFKTAILEFKKQSSI